MYVHKVHKMQWFMMDGIYDTSVCMRAFVQHKRRLMEVVPRLIWWHFCTCFMDREYAAIFNWLKTLRLSPK
jgi:hypothetical protein